MGLLLQDLQRVRDVCVLGNRKEAVDTIDECKNRINVRLGVWEE